MSARRRGLRIALAASLFAALPTSCVLGELTADREDTSGSGSASSASGSGVECSSAAECPGPMPPLSPQCAAAMCNGGLCDLYYAPAAPLLLQEPNDCYTVQCDGAGSLQNAPNSTDSPPSDNNACTIDACNNGVATYTPMPAYSKCPEGYCNAQAICAPPKPCTQPDECFVSECVQTSCVNSSCFYSLLPAKVPCNTATMPWDQCDGAGACVDCVDANGCLQGQRCVGNVCK